MRKLFTLSFFIFLQINANGQNDVIDSLQALLQTERRDTARANIYNQLSFLYLNRNADTSLHYAQQAMTLAQTSHSVLLESAILNNIALVFQQIGDNVRALDFLLQSLKKAESINDRKRMSSAMLNIGNICSELGDKRGSMVYFRKALEIRQQLKDDRGVAACLLNIGDAYEKLDILDSARIFTIMANDLATRISHKALWGISTGNLGNIYVKRGEPAIAMSYYRSAIPVLMTAGNLASVCEFSLGIAGLFEKARQLDSAVHYGKFALQTAQKGSFLSAQLQASTFLADFYKELSNVDSAYQYMIMMISTKDSIFNEEKVRQIQSLNLSEVVRQQKLEAEKWEMAQERKLYIQYALTAIAIIGFGMVFFILSRSVIVNEKWVRFLGILSLLLVFEFINLVLHPLLANLTFHSPVFMLLIMVAIAALLIPIHHKLEHFVVHHMTIKNKLVRLQAAKKTVARLEGEVAELPLKK